VAKLASKVIYLAMLLSILTVSCTKPLARNDSEQYAGTELSGKAPDFSLIDQHGRQMSLSDLHGKIVVLSFMDPHCADICILTSQDIKKAYQNLGSLRDQVVFLAINVNPEVSSKKDINKAIRQWGLEEISNFHFLNGSPSTLRTVWKNYNVLSEKSQKYGGQIIHTPGIFIIDQQGNKKWYVYTPLGWQGPNMSDLMLQHIRGLAS